MSVPLISPALAKAAHSGPILAIERLEQGIRHTAPHSHAPGQLIGSFSGLLSVTGPDGSWVVPATHAIWMPPHFSHALRSHGPFRGWSVYVAEGACTRLSYNSLTVRVNGLLRELVHRAASWQSIPETEAEHRLADVLLDEVAASRVEPLGLPHPQNLGLRHITELILADLANDDPLEHWADQCGLSPRTLARRFIAETGFGFCEWRQRARALRAIELLAEGLAVTTVAIDLGYHNVSAFIAMFKRTMGVTPGSYAREQMKATVK